MNRLTAHDVAVSYGCPTEADAQATVAALAERGISARVVMTEDESLVTITQRDVARAMPIVRHHGCT
jgi:type III secretory pathway lipoprotein EscJ